MAYETIYSGATKNKYGEIINVKILKQDYVGIITALTLTDIVVRYNDASQIITKSLDLGIINTFEFSTLNDLFRNYERQYKIVVINETTNFQYFEGYLVVDIIEQAFFKNSQITLTFTDYLIRLKDVEPPTVLNNYGERKNLIEIIQNCISLTGFEYDFNVNSKIYHSGTNTNNEYSCLNQTYIDVDIFWLNNIEKMNAFDVIIEILKTFMLTMYEYNGAWYIERYDDINNNISNWTKFNSNTSTGISTPTKYQSYNKQIGDFNYVNKSQTISYNSGVNEFEIELSESGYQSMTYNDFTNISSVESDSILPTPLNKNWVYSNEVDALSYTVITPRVTPYFEISNSMLFGLWIDPSKFELDSTISPNQLYKTRGIFTRFDCTVTPTGDTASTLKINWKWANLNGANSKAYFKDNYLVSYRLYYYLRDVKTNKYYYYDNVTDSTNAKWILGDGNVINYLNYVDVNKEDIDQSTGIGDINISIPISSIENIPFQDTGIILGICYGTYNWIFSIYDETNVLDDIIVGDITVTVETNLPDNNIIAKINEGFLKKEKVSLKIFDISNLNFTNGLYFQNAGEFLRCYNWSDDAGLTYKNIVDQYITSKYKFMNKNTLSLGGTIITNNKLKPLSILTDDNLKLDGNNIPILLRSFTNDIIKSQYQIITEEYSVDEINLIK